MTQTLFGERQLHTPADVLAQTRHLAESLATGAAERDLERRLPYAEIAQLAASGILAARVPVAHGGPGIDIKVLADVCVLLAEADPNVAQAVFPHFWVAEELLLYGTPEQQARYFGLMRQGVVFSGAHAERGGQRIGELATQIRAEGDAWRISGTKYYCTGSLFAQYLLVSALNEKGEKAIALVPVDRAGLARVDDWDGMGQRTTASGTVTLDNVRIEADEVIANGNWRTRHTYFNPFAQLIHSAIDAGIARGVLKEAAHYTQTRARPTMESGVLRAVDDPYVLHTFGEMAVQAHTAVAMVERAAGVLQTTIDAYYLGEITQELLSAATLAVAEAKIVSTDASLRVSEALYRLGGASATSRALNLDRHWRNARTHTTHDPIAYKYRAIGEYHLKGLLPPLNGKT